MFEKEKNFTSSDVKAELKDVPLPTPPQVIVLTLSKEYAQVLKVFLGSQPSGVRLVGLALYDALCRVI